MRSRLVRRGLTLLGLAILGVMSTIYPIACAIVSVGIVVGVVLFLTSRFNRGLFLWWLLLSYRAFVPRLGQIDVTDMASSGVALAAEFFILFYIGTLLFIDIVPLIILGALRKMGTVTKMSLVFALAATVGVLGAPLGMFAIAAAAKLMVAIVLCAYLSEASETMGQARRFLSVTYLGLVPYLMLPWIALLFAPEHAFTPERRLIGFWMYPVVLGIIGSLISLVTVVRCLQAERLRARLGYGLAAMASLLTSIGSGGKTGFVVLIVGVMFMLGMRSSPLRRKVITVTGMVLVVSLLSVMYDLLPASHLISWAGDPEKTLTISGRTLLWSEVLMQSTEGVWEFMLGHGYTSARINGFLIHGTTWISTEAHNAFLNVLYELGSAGLIVLVLISVFAVVALRSALMATRDSSHRAIVEETSIILIGLMVGGLSVSLYGGMPRAEGLIFWAVVGVAGSLKRLSIGEVASRTNAE